MSWGVVLPDGSAGEFVAYGYDFPAPAERITAFEETLEAVLRLWSEPAVDLDGSFVRLRGARCEPKPRSRPPVWTGTHGPRGLRTAARYADVANWNVGLDDFRRLSGVLDEACAAVGRDPATIEVVRQDHFIGAPEQVVPKVQAFADAGARHVVVLFLDAEHSDESAQRFLRDVVPEITHP